MKGPYDDTIIGEAKEAVLFGDESETVITLKALS